MAQKNLKIVQVLSFLKDIFNFLPGWFHWLVSDKKRITSNTIKYFPKVNVIVLLLILTIFHKYKKEEDLRSKTEISLISTLAHNKKSFKSIGFSPILRFVFCSKF